MYVFMSSLRRRLYTAQVPELRHSFDSVAKYDIRLFGLQRQGSVPLSSATIGDVDGALLLQNETVSELAETYLSVWPTGPRHPDQIVGFSVLSSSLRP